MELFRAKVRYRLSPSQEKCIGREGLKTYAAFQMLLAKTAAKIVLKFFKRKVLGLDLVRGNVWGNSSFL